MKYHPNFRRMPAPRISKPTRPLTRREREDIADRTFERGSPVPFHCAVCDEHWEPINPSLDLVVSCSTTKAARHAWERWAEEQGVTGQHHLVITFTPPAMEKRRPREEQSSFLVDLDWLVLEDELEQCDHADRALGL